METPQASAPQNAAARFVVKGQYVKDLSFENPHAPQSLLVQNEKPKIDISVDIKAQKLQEDMYELVLQIGARAAVGKNTLFMIDLSYAGIFAMINIPKDIVEQVVLVDCPFTIFPFARRVIADVTRDGGFPPLLLDPIDFHALYLQKGKAAAPKEAKA